MAYAATCYHLFSYNILKTTRHHTTWRIQPVESKTRTYHGHVGVERRTAGRRGRAGPSKKGRRRVYSPRRQMSPLPSKASGHREQLFWTFRRKHEQTKCYLNRMEEDDNRLTRNWPVAYKRFIRGTTAALCSWLLADGPTPICLRPRKPGKACPRKPGHTTGGSRRGCERRGGGKKWAWAGWDTDRSVRRGDERRMPPKGFREEGSNQTPNPFRVEGKTKT